MSKMMTPEQYARLPKYVRDHIEHLEMRLAEEKRQFASTFKVATEESAIILNPYHLQDGHAVELEPDAIIRFRLGRTRFDVDIRRHNIGPVGAFLNISEYGSDGIAVIPVASNVIAVRARDDRH